MFLSEALPISSSTLRTGIENIKEVLKTSSYESKFRCLRHARSCSFSEKVDFDVMSPSCQDDSGARQDAPQDNGITDWEFLKSRMRIFSWHSSGLASEISTRMEIPSLSSPERNRGFQLIFNAAASRSGEVTLKEPRGGAKK